LRNADLDLKLIAGFTLLAMAFIFVPVLNDTFMRPILGLSMILFVPGYSLIAALFPRKSDIGSLERVALSFGLSIAVVPLIGLALNYTPWGIRLDPIAVCLTLFTLACSLFANHRRHELPAQERFSVDPAKLYAIARDAMSADKTALDRALTALLVLSVLVSALTIAYVVMFPKQGEKFTEFYILGQDGKADKYPLKFSTGEQKPVIVGIVNHEYRNVTYDILVSLKDNYSVTALYAGRFTLADNETLETPVSVSSDHAGTGMKVDFLLYKDGNMTAPYRECYLWVNVSEKK
jgi:uncharacterized membrane protein